MQFSFLNSLITSPWQIDALTLNQFLPVFRGILNGINFEPEKASEDYLPKKIICSSETDEQINTTEQRKEKFINVQPLKGIIMRDTTPCGVIGTREIARNLLQADADESIVGHILLIDSGGGQATAVADITEAIKKLKKHCVAFIDGNMCSAAMYIGSFCKKIIAERAENNIGCIGTMIELEGFPKANVDTNGYTTLRIYADEATEKNEEYEEAIAGNIKLIKERLLNPHNKKFIEDIKANRPNVKEEELHGRTFRAEEVCGTLIDEIGPFESAVNYIIENTNINNQNQNSQKMENISKTLSALNTEELVFVDGTTTLNEEQIQNIETALSEKDTLSEDLSKAKKELEEAQKTILENESKIKELQTTAGEDSATVITETDTTTSTVSDPAEAFLKNISEVNKYLN